MEPDQPQSARARRFRFVTCLGRGGFGEVYRATMTDRGGVTTEVAVKVLHGEVDPEGKAVLRLRDEAHLLAALRHPAILKVHDLVLLGGRAALVTEFVDGEDLSSLLRHDVRMPLRAVVDTIGQVAAALAAALDAKGPGGEPLGLVHRDIKPANIRIGRHGEVKVLDFGIARASGLERAAPTDNDAIVGSWQYMSPEAFVGDYDPPADVFSLGCLLYEGLASVRLYQGFVLKDLVRLSADPKALKQRIKERFALFPRSVPTTVRRLCRSMLAPAPADRPTAEDVVRLCDEVLEGLPPPSLRQWCRERTWPDAVAQRGEFEGTELLEESEHPIVLSIPPTSTLAPALSVRAQPTVAIAASGLMGLTLGAAALGVVLVALILFQWSGSPASRAADAPLPALTQNEVAERPARPAAVVPVQPEDPALPVPAPAPTAVPRAVDKAPSTPPAPAWVGVSDKSKVAIRLVAGAETVVPPTRIAPGTWRVEADFGAGFVQSGTLLAEPRGRYEVWCKVLTRECELR